jgi:hypothetical protein
MLKLLFDAIKEHQATGSATKSAQAGAIFFSN